MLSVTTLAADGETVVVSVRPVCVRPGSAGSSPMVTLGVVAPVATRTVKREKSLAAYCTIAPYVRPANAPSGLGMSRSTAGFAGASSTSVIACPPPGTSISANARRSGNPANGGGPQLAVRPGP